MSFEEGLRFGADAFAQGVAQRRQAALDEQNRQLWEQQMQGLRRENTRQDDITSAVQDYMGAPSRGMAPAGAGLNGAQPVFDPNNPPDVATTYPVRQGGLSVPGDTGAAQPIPNVRRQQLGARSRLAALSRDFKGMEAAETEGRIMDVQDDFEKNKARLDDPKFIAELSSHINNNNRYVTVTKPQTDAKGRVTGPPQMSIVGADGQASTFQPSKTQFQQLAYGDALIRAGFMEQGMNVIKGVNGDLADAINRSNDLQKGAFKENVDASSKFTTGQAQMMAAGAAAQNARTNEMARQSVVDEREALRSDTETARGLYAKFDALTPEEQDGPKGRALMREFNMLSIKPGGIMPVQTPRAGAGMGGAGRGPVVDQKQNDDGSYTAFRKDTGEAVYNTVHGQKMPLGMTVQDYQKARDTAAKAQIPMVGGFDENGVYQLGYRGANGVMYDNVQEAAMAKPQASRGGEPTSSTLVPPNTRLGKAGAVLKSAAEYGANVMPVSRGLKTGREAFGAARDYLLEPLPEEPVGNRRSSGLVTR